MNNIKEILEELRNEPGKNAKLEILEKHKDNELWKRIIYYAYNSNFNYYIQKFKELPEDWCRTVGEEEISLESIFQVLDTLKSQSVRGNEGIELVYDTMYDLNEDDVEVFKLILGRDLKVGCSTSSFNKVYKKLIPTTPYMGCKGFDEKAIRKVIVRDGGIYSEVKNDGRYINAILANGIERVSREGKPTTVNGKFMQELKRLSLHIGDEHVLNGELMLHGFDRGQANGLIARIINVNSKLESDNARDIAKGKAAKTKLEKDTGLSFEELEDRIYIICWDIISYESYLDGFDKTPREKRIEYMQDILKEFGSEYIIPQEAKWCTTYEEVIRDFKEKLDEGLEGTVVKAQFCPWKDGKTSEQWKMKVEFTVEMKIIGFNYGTKGTKYENTISALRLSSECGKMICNADGIEDTVKNKDYCKDDFRDNQENWMGDIVEMKCNGLSIDKDGNYNFYYPKYMLKRDDKSVADTQEEIIQKEREALKLKSV